jgi:hypothetical protein
MSESSIARIVAARADMTVCRNPDVLLIGDVSIARDVRA